MRASARWAGAAARRPRGWLARPEAPHDKLMVVNFLAIAVVNFWVDGHTRTVP